MSINNELDKTLLKTKFKRSNITQYKQLFIIIIYKIFMLRDDNNAVLYDFFFHTCLK